MGIVQNISKALKLPPYLLVGRFMFSSVNFFLLKKIPILKRSKFWLVKLKSPFRQLKLSLLDDWQTTFLIAKRNL